MSDQRKSTKYLALAAKAAAEEQNWELLRLLSELLAGSQPTITTAPPQ